MRRLIAAILAVLLLAVPAAAQQQLNQFPGNLVNKSTSTITISNTTTATTLYTTTVPVRYFQNLRQPFAGAGSLHLSLLGTITTAPQPGAANLGCNFGGSTASIALVNGATITGAISSAPFILDLWVRTQTATVPFVMGRLHVQTVAGTTILPFSAAVVGTTSLTAAQTLVCTWQWGSANSTNSLTINSGALMVGE